MSTNPIDGKRILLGVTGSIACYKIIDFASKLTQAGALVDVVLTESAQKFVTSLSFRSVTGRKVYHSMWDESEHVQHVHLGENADLMIVAPATAHTMGKIAHGLADNLLSMLALTVRCPIIMVPAMDGGMYQNPATQANSHLLKERGVQFWGPIMGRMASGLSGLGRMMEPNDLLERVQLHFAQQADRPLSGRKVVITAGPTQERLDPVRFLTNRSSGKQGVGIAEAAVALGANVTLITGPIQVAVPFGVTHVAIESALQLNDAVLVACDGADVLIMAAAVADYRPAEVATQKIKKKTDSGDGLTIHLVRNPDILMNVARQRKEKQFPRVVVGFAAETTNVIHYGQDKAKRKGLDFIVANDVSQADAGFGVDTNRILIIDQDGLVGEPLPLLSKRDVGFHLMELIVEKLALSE